MTARLLRWLTAVVVAVLVTSAPAAGAGATTAPPDDGEAPPPSYVDNPFIPEDRNLGDCISAVPKPGCGSEERSDVRQFLVFGALVAGLGLIGWRIVAGVRNQQRQPQP